MIYKYTYTTPKQFSNIIMTSDGKYLTGLWFEETKYGLRIKSDFIQKDIPIFKEVAAWLDIYFSEKKPTFTPKYKIEVRTAFQNEVLDIVNTIQYGKLLTYSDIAKVIARNRNIEKMSCQAVGRALGCNPICIIIPCHRVVGSNGDLLGYSGGINNKRELLKLEGIDISKQ